ncbi:unnamed protein product [Urochloa decumbens]|uniref:Protein kinase domain-containing protein n=1 Tax=Urochloa decumbens TaxID=240449 RepID=A0ABC9EJL0_9POAL
MAPTKTSPVAALLQLFIISAAAAGAAGDAAPPPAAIGLSNCSTTCGNVTVPYPFGFGPRRCYWPGFNLTCDATHRPPRLLLGDGSLRVVNISLGRNNNTVRVVRARSGVSADTNDRNVGVSIPTISSFSFAGGSYTLATSNELVVTGCNKLATLVGDVGVANNNLSNIVISGCASICSDSDSDSDSAEGLLAAKDPTGKYCSGVSGCCQAPVSFHQSSPTGIELRSLNDDPNYTGQGMPTNVFVAEKGWFDQGGDMLLKSAYDGWPESPKLLDEAPIVLQWAVTQRIPMPDKKHLRGKVCPRDTARMLCKSNNSECAYSDFPIGYTCNCADGYQGNPYIFDGCRDVDECRLPQEEIGCFGHCTNTIGSFSCRCAQGTIGNYTLSGGCVPIRSITVTIMNSPRISIGIGVGSAAGLIILVLIAIFMAQRVKHRRETKLKQKFFKQNRGQLLQQLVSQNADIAERMIISVDEIAKATNNFDQSRELGGGGHGTVYKGILSNLRVVAIKKSKITVQNEIDEFINEVAILSQINHRNVVKLFGCCLETEVPLLVYEFISNGTLYHHLHVEGPRSLSWGTRLRIATETSKALAYLHSSVSIPVIHRDIKSTNILLDDTLTSKISDFGASRYIPLDKTGLTTRVQGTIGYLDPMYFYTGRLTDKSDVYSFGVILVELLTRKKPFSYMTSEGEGLVSHFVHLLAESNLPQILDPQVVEEGGQEVQEVAVLAASCIKLKAEDRPTMRQVEHTLEGLYASKKYKEHNVVTGEFEEGCSITMNCRSTQEMQVTVESSRRYSFEQEVLMSARYPR